jgi:hypothetical protein
VRNPIRDTFVGCCAWIEEHGARSREHKVKSNAVRARSCRERGAFNNSEFNVVDFLIFDI